MHPRPPDDLIQLLQCPVPQTRCRSHHAELLIGGAWPRRCRSEDRTAGLIRRLLSLGLEAGVDPIWFCGDHGHRSVKMVRAGYPEGAWRRR